MKLSRESVPINRFRVSDPGVARLLANERLTPPDSDDVRHVVLDISGLDFRYLEGQSLGVLAPGVDEAGRPHKLRLYSIASSRSGDDGDGRTVSLCVKRVVVRDDGERRGPASNFLCDAAPGDPVRITEPVGRNFLLPEDPAVDLILIATGTGIAPFRAFSRRVYQERPAFAGTVSLRFGVRRASEILYRSKLEGYLGRAGYRLSYALSREEIGPGGCRLYVQHRLTEQVAEVWDWLVDGSGYAYICGLKGMECGIDAVFETYARSMGASWDEVRRSLRREGRFQVETY